MHEYYRKSRTQTKGLKDTVLDGCFDLNILFLIIETKKLKKNIFLI